MITKNEANCGCGTRKQSVNDEPMEKEGHAPEGTPEIVGYKVGMLIAAGTAMAANCEPCLNKLVPDLKEAGVSDADIRMAVVIGQAVKDRPAAIMKEAADVLTGTQMSDPAPLGDCPIEKMKQRAA